MTLHADPRARSDRPGRSDPRVYGLVRDRGGLGLRLRRGVRRRRPHLAHPRRSHTTTDNPSGNAYGPGYTGSSDEWLQESIDLTPFAGGPVLLRFEYVTDDAVYLDGLLIDDLSIPELDLDLSSTDDDWHADGFSLAGTFPCRRTSSCRSSRPPPTGASGSPGSILTTATTRKRP